MKGETALTVDGRELTLVLDHAALIAAERAYGKPLAITMAEASLGFVGAAASMLFGALQRRHPELKMDDATALMLEHADLVGPAIEAAAQAAFPKQAEGGEEPRPPAKPRGGTNSGRSGAKRGSTRTASSKRPRASSKSSSARG